MGKLLAFFSFAFIQFVSAAPHHGEVLNQYLAPMKTRIVKLEQNWNKTQTSVTKNKESIDALRANLEKQIKALNESLPTMIENIIQKMNAPKAEEIAIFQENFEPNENGEFVHNWELLERSEGSNSTFEISNCTFNKGHSLQLDPIHHIVSLFPNYTTTDKPLILQFTLKPSLIAPSFGFGYKYIAVKLHYCGQTFYNLNKNYSGFHDNIFKVSFLYGSVYLSRNNSYIGSKGKFETAPISEYPIEKHSMEPFFFRFELDATGKCFNIFINDVKLSDACMEEKFFIEDLCSISILAKGGGIVKYEIDDILLTNNKQ